MADARRHRTSRAPLLTVIAVVVLAGVGYGGWHYVNASGAESDPAVEEAPKTVPVVAEAVRQGDYPIHLNGLGTVEALNSVIVRAQVTGQIQKVAFKEGQIVKAGDVLVEIDPRPLQAALEQANAKLAQDQSSLADAQANLDRFSKLARQQITTRQQLDTQAALVSQATSQVAGDQAAVDNARTQLSYATVRAPIDGRVGFRLADVGNLVSPADASGIVTIQQVTPIAAIFTAPESELGALTAALAEGRPAVEALSSDGRTTLAKGTLRLLDNTVDAASGTVRLKAVFPNEDSALWPGMSVTTRVLVRTQANAAIVNDAAVQHGPDGLFAYVVGRGGKAEMRKIAVAESEGGQALVSDGLKPGEQVIVDGQYGVQPGARVKVRSAAAMAKAAAPDAPAVAED